MFAGLRDHFHLHRDIFANASRIVHHLQRSWGSGRAWNAVHDRTGDFVRQFEGYYVDELTLRDHLVQVIPCLCASPGLTDCLMFRTRVCTHRVVCEDPDSLECHNSLCTASGSLSIVQCGTPAAHTDAGLSALTAAC